MKKEKKKRKRGTGYITVSSIYPLWMCCWARNLGSVPHRRQSLALLVLTTNKLVGLISGPSRFIFFFFFFRGGNLSTIYIKKTASVQSIYSVIQSQTRVGDIAEIHTVIIIVLVFPPDYTKLFNFQFWEKGRETCRLWFWLRETPINKSRKTKTRRGPFQHTRAVIVWHLKRHWKWNLWEKVEDGQVFSSSSGFHHFFF